MVANRSKYPLMIEMILVPIVFLLHFFAFEPIYILGSAVALSSYGGLLPIFQKQKPNGFFEHKLLLLSTIACPQYQTSNPVTSDASNTDTMQWLRRIIKIMA